MSKLYKINTKKFIGFLVCLALIILTLPLQAHYNNFSTHFSTYDTIPITLANANDTTVQPKKKDTIKHTVIDTLLISKDSIDAPVKYSASDSGVLIISSKQFILYGSAQTTYKDMELEAATIEYEQDKQTIKAKGSSDTAKDSLKKTKFKQGEMTTLSDSIAYNLQSQKGITYNTYYQEGELFVNAGKLKKADSNIVYAYKGSFTTCNLDTPHFAFRTKKMKIINDKIGVSGPAHPEFEGVPIPLYIPFGIYPLSTGRKSGILPPTFTSSEDFGLGLESFGYYKVINDNIDIITRANLYTYGGWSINTNSKYIKRYKYAGSVNIAFQKNKTLNRVSTKTQDEFNTSSSYMINWSHNRDSKARPGTNFSANVNFGSTRFNQNILNNPYQNFNNQLTSSVAYSKNWNGKYNLSLNLNHNQNNNTHLVNLSLPNTNFNVVTFYPFEKKEAAGTPKWYEKIGIGYTGNFQNRISFYDTAFSTRKLLDTLQWGAEHSIPITLSLPSLGPITIGPSISFQQRWFGQKTHRYWDATDSLVKTTTQKGYYVQNSMSFGISASTRIFGTYQFKKGRVKAIRHEVRPMFGLSYTPDLASKNFYNVQVDTSGRTMRFSEFDGNIYSSYSEGNFGGISFGIDNLLEMKVRDTKDSSVEDKKIKLIDGFGFNSSYNLLADSFALGTFNFYVRSTLFEKINITANAILDPYQVDNFGKRKNVLMVKQGKLGRITSGSLAISTSLSSKSTNGSKENNTSNLPIDPFLTPEEQQRQLDYIRHNPAEYTDFNIPWRLDLSYSLSFSKVLQPDYSGYKTFVYSSINFNGDFSLTPKWKIGATGYYDVKNLKLQQFSMFISREMHCWQLSVNVTPVGLWRSFNIIISPKSGILRDLKINRNRTFSNQ
ncbi:MAG: LPS-assembly protein LptD [Chitinophagaceae bacterium]|nr:LPS-assembly protein LptD [Chitinophagaceae bacterium]MCW5904982.1 LPS-assembly protein LptD [Chitinophagaceae bacterium]